jgi:hypothetical protein
VRHHLTPATLARSPVDVADDLAGIHATDPVSAFLGVAARTSGLTPADLEHALYDDRSLLRVLGMRGTMFVVPRELAGIVHAACTRKIAAAERTRTVRMLAEAGVAADAERWLSRVEADTVAALERQGEATAAELTRDVPELGVQIPFGEGKKWAGTFGVSTRLLFLLAAEGRVIRGRPRGSWVSSQYRWAPMDRWTAGGLSSWPQDEARAELVGRWLRAYGPGTETDLRWWTGWTLGELRRAIARVQPIEVQLEGGRSGLVLGDDVGDGAARDGGDGEPWAALLPALDTTVMGWKERDWFLGPHQRRLFDRNGNAGPTVWWHSQVVGGWTQRPDGGIALRLLEDVGREATLAIEATAGRLRDWLGPVRFTPRFRTPLEQELGA